MRGTRAKAERTAEQPNPGRKHGGAAKVGQERRHMPSLSYADRKALRSTMDRRGRQAAGRWAGPL